MSIATYQEKKKDDIIIEFGTFSDEFYLILEGQCEVIVPLKTNDDFKHTDFEMKMLLEQLNKNVSEIELFK